MAQAIGDGDDGTSCTAWNATVDRLCAGPDAVLVRGHIGHARALCLKASAFCATSFHPLHGDRVDPRLIAAFRKQFGRERHSSR